MIMLELSVWRVTVYCITCCQRVYQKSFLNKPVPIGKLLIQSLEWLFHNFSETHHFTDHAKTTGKIPSAICELFGNKTKNQIQNRILMLGAAMQKCSSKMGV